MRPLVNVRPTPEQLKIVSNNQLGPEVIRGCAGSGKTTTALMKLNALTLAFHMQKQREGANEPVRGLVLTFNRTLRGYVNDLAQEQLDASLDVKLEVSTFAHWSKNRLETNDIIDKQDAESHLKYLGAGIKLDPDFLVSEVEYLRGRFFPERYDEYLTAIRAGRGGKPRVDRALREKVLNDVVRPYEDFLIKKGLCDWNSMAVKLAKNNFGTKYDFIIVDETQDFSANQLRAITQHLEDRHCLTFVLDTAQRIYARGFTWQEAGIVIAGRSKRLTVNYRNTSRLVDFVLPLLKNINLDTDGTIPNSNDCAIKGDLPIIINGRFSAQTDYIIQLLSQVDLSSETVAILHPFGGGWFQYLRDCLNAKGIEYIEISRKSEWPKGNENVALCTMHSAKGLEFDYVIVAGISSQTFSHDMDDEDDKKLNCKRLLAMSITRARKNVVLGFDSRKPALIKSEFEAGTYKEIDL
ncbi:3'-5' exonuclease [Neptunomonas sp.]|uniref:3'-5' exonuclease n=1 Tax=Neptunomonas sp. TaxID=1971898 RepID=UPI003565E282